MKLFYLLANLEGADYSGKYLFNYDNDMVMLGATDSISAANRFLQSVYLVDGRVICAITECNNYLPLGFCKRDAGCYPSRLLYPSDYDACSVAIAGKICCSKCKSWIVVDENGDNRIR